MTFQLVLAIISQGCLVVDVDATCAFFLSCADLWCSGQWSSFLPCFMRALDLMEGVVNVLRSVTLVQRGFCWCIWGFWRVYSRGEFEAKYKNHILVCLGEWGWVTNARLQRKLL